MQEAFWEDPRVLFISVHQEGCYPEPIGPDGKTRAHGALTEAGGGAGAGTTINVPLPPGCGHGAYSDAFSRVVEPAARRFGRCDAIVVSAGYDAGYFDPLARQALGGTAFFDMGMRLRALAEELCEGRLLAVHEGGYSEFHTPFLCLRFIEGLLTAPGERPFVNPEGKTDPFQDGIDKVGAGTNELQVWQAEAVDRAVRAAGLA